MTGKKFKQIRHSMEYSQQGLAQRLGVHRETIIRIEKSAIVPERYRLAILGLQK